MSSSLVKIVKIPRGRTVKLLYLQFPFVVVVHLLGEYQVLGARRVGVVGEAHREAIFAFFDVTVTTVRPNRPNNE